MTEEQEAPVPAEPTDARRQEIEAVMSRPGGMREYWASPELQAEYQQSLTPAGVSEVAEALNVDQQLVSEGFDRVDAAFQGLDTSDLDDAFEGLSDRVKQAWLEAVVSPHRLEEIASALTDAEVEEAKYFVANLLPQERRAIDRILWL